MNFNLQDLVAAIPGGIVGIIVAWLGLKGRKEETSATFNDSLLQRQGDRIASLEQRLDGVEDRLRETESKLRVEEDRTHILRRALEDSIEWLREFVDWARRGSVGSPPEPDLADLADVLRRSRVFPTARNPPEPIRDSEK